MSGHDELDKRRALLPAIEEVEAERADVIVFAEHDRAFRNAAVQREAVKLVEAAGGELHCADIGRLVDQNGSDDEWFNGSLHGLLTEKQWRDDPPQVDGGRRRGGRSRARCPAC